MEEDEDSVSHARPVRQVARTSVMERVRSAIEEIRVRRIRNLRQILSSSEVKFYKSTDKLPIDSH